MKPLYQARYRGKPEWYWEYTTRGYTVTDLEKAKKPTYKWLAEAKKRNKPLQVQVVIVDPEKRWGEVMWEGFYLKEEFWKVDKEAERCQIVRDITKDLLEEECQAEDDKCRIAKEIADKVVKKECSSKKRRIGLGKWEEIKEERITDYLNYDLNPDDIQNKRNPFPSKMYRWASKDEWENVKEGDRAGGHWSTNLGDFAYMTEYKVLLVTKNREEKDWVGEAMHTYSNIKKQDILEVYTYNTTISLWENIL